MPAVADGGTEISQRTTRIRPPAQFVARLGGIEIGLAGGGVVADGGAELQPRDPAAQSRQAVFEFRFGAPRRLRRT